MGAMNRLKVNERTSIDALHGRGWSKRRIARELGLDRATVRRHLTAAKAATPHTGSPSRDGADAATVNTGSAEDAEPKAATHPHTGSDAADHGPASLCDPWFEAIGQGFRAGLSVQRIFQDLVAGHGFPGSYHSVRRFVRRRFGPDQEPPFRRMECAAGQELQVDFGQGAWVVEDGRRRRTHLFRCVLSHSRNKAGP